MEIVKKYTALMVRDTMIDNVCNVKLQRGQVKGPYWNEIYPETEFDTEQEAIDWAYEYDDWATWLIVPVISFSNHK